MIRQSVKSCLFTFFVLVTGSCCLAEEGMWTFDSIPVDSLKSKYKFSPSAEWLDHLRLSSVRFNNGGSGSFASANGLVLTNHHVAVNFLQKISNKDRDYVTTGFYAAHEEEEIRCPDLDVNVLVGLRDVTEEIQEAVHDTMDNMEALQAKESLIARMEKKAQDSTGLECTVVSLFAGGEYWLYQYKKYSDVRLVMAPERQAAYFGGDDDNFTYPRYDLDIAFFRIYENDRPIRADHYLKWNRKGAAEDELVFVSGHPGRTSRLYSVHGLVYSKDYSMPMILNYIDERLAILDGYAKKGREEERKALPTIFGLNNSKKAYEGMLLGLSLPGVIEGKKRVEEDFKNRFFSDPGYLAQYGNPWDSLAAVRSLQIENEERWYYRKIIGSRLADWAVDLVICHQELIKPDSDRLEGYHDSELDNLKHRILSRAPVYKDYEIHNFTGGLSISLKHLGKDDSFIGAALSGHEPSEIAPSLIEKTSMDQIDFREKLWNADLEAIEQCRDTLIVWARKMAPIIRNDIEMKRKMITSKMDRASNNLAKARFAIYGKTTYPDANFTLRLTYGSVKEYRMNGTKAPVNTTLYGLYDRSLSFNQKGDYVLPERFWKRQKKLDLSTPVNFICDCDIIGGNSGSPVVNRDGEFIGIIFDGNIESLAGRFYFDPSVNRAVSVHAAYIMEALKKLYDAGALLKEIEGK
ncbi:S46 family peptidase [bacterium]|nr:S46 family peptidase [bacterium]